MVMAVGLGRARHDPNTREHDEDESDEAAHDVPFGRLVS
jgi:hypothetical protein